MSFRGALAGLAMLLLALVWVSIRTEALPVFAAVTATVLVCVWFFATIRGYPPANEIGAYFVVAVALYAVVPLLTYLLRDMTFARTSDLRLQVMGVDTGEMALHGWRYALFLGAFAAAYRLWRPEGRAQASLDMPDSRVIPLIVTMAVAIQIFLLAYFQLYGIGGENYGEFNASRAVASSSAPLLIRQIADHAERGVSALKCLILVYLFAKKRYSIIVVWLTVEVARSAITLHERTSAVLLLAAAAFLYHRFVRPLRYYQCLAAGLGGMLAFLVFGSIRGFGSSSDFRPADLIDHTNEFEAIFSTGLDIWRRRTLGALPDIPLQLYLADLFALVPSQFLPFNKWTGPEWYLELLQLRGTGQGYTWGVMSEAGIGLGWVELILRGVGIGWLFARLHSGYVGNANRFWVTVAYVWACTNCYQSFRASSFQLIVLFWLEVMPFFALPYLLDRRRKMRGNTKQRDRIAVNRWNPSFAGNGRIRWR